ncbi:hypothetical protein ACIPV9_11250 [Pseudomonas psychrophila]|uniref:hypothetical protein n=1 Tax=Pseudomonas psychrophila TaxID=122355 RepID=UPI0038212664
MSDEITQKSHGPPGLQVRLHYMHADLHKKGHKACRRERDKCFFRDVLILAVLFRDRGTLFTPITGNRAYAYLLIPAYKKPVEAGLRELY